MIKYIKLYLRLSKVILAVLAGLTVWLGWRASKVEFNFSMEKLFASGDAEMRTYEEFRGRYGNDDAVLYVAFKSPRAMSPETLARIRELSAKLAAVPGVRDVVALDDAIEFFRPYRLSEEALDREVCSNPLFRGSLISADGRTACLWVMLAPEVDTERKRNEAIEKVQALLAAEESATGLRFHMAGIPVIEHEYVVLTKRDLLTFMPIAVGVFMLLLCLYFRNVLGTFLPLATVGLAIVWTVGLMQVFGRSMGILSSIIPNLILIMGVCDAIHLLSRYQEDLRVAPDKREALARTMFVMVFACFLTAFTTSIGFASLVTTPVEIIREFGIITAVGIMIGYVMTVQFLPAALDNMAPLRGRVFDEFADRFSDRLMERIARINHKRLWAVYAVTAVIVAVSIAGIFRLKQESSWLQDIRGENPVHEAHDFLEENLSPVFTADLEITGPPGSMKDPAMLRKIEKFEAAVASWQHPAHPETRTAYAVSYVDLMKEANRARVLAPRAVAAFGDRKKIEALLSDEKYRALPATPREVEECLKLRTVLDRAGKEEDFLKRVVRDDFSAMRISVRINALNSVYLQDFADAVRREHETRFAGDFGLTLTGKSWLAKRAMDKVVGNMISSFAVAAVPIFLCMLVLFASFKVGLLSMIPNFVPMIITAGFMGWMGIHLNFSTVTVFSISLGIAVDNTIHYLSRLRIELPKDDDPVAAMVRTLRGAGRPMIFSTILLVLGFGAILTSNFRFTFHFGLLGGFTMIVALLCDLFITPSLFLLFRPRVPRWERLEKKLVAFDACLSRLFEKSGAKLD